MKTEQLELINKVQRLAKDLVKDVYSSPFNTDLAYSLVNEISEVIEELQEFNDVEGFLELEGND